MYVKGSNGAVPATGVGRPDRADRSASHRRSPPSPISVSGAERWASGPAAQRMTPPGHRIDEFSLHGVNPAGVLFRSPAFSPVNRT